MLRSRCLSIASIRSTQVKSFSTWGAITHFANIPSRSRPFYIRAVESNNLKIFNRQWKPMQQYRCQSTIPEEYSSINTCLVDKTLLEEDVQRSLKMKEWEQQLIDCRKRGDWKQTLKLLDRIDQDGYRLTSEMYEQAIAACARVGKIEFLSDILRNMQIDGIVPSTRTVDFMTQGYLAQEEWSQIIRLTHDMVNKEVVLSDGAFHAAMEACSNTKNAKAARDIIMKAKVAIQEDNSENKLLSNLSGLTSKHFAAGIRACGKGCRPDLALSVFEHMEAVHGISADIEVFTELTRAQMRSSTINETLQTFAVAYDRNIAFPDKFYLGLTDFLIQKGAQWQAKRVFHQLLAKGIEPSSSLWLRMTAMYSSQNNLDEMRKCWQQVVEGGDKIQPQLWHFSRAMHEISKNGQPDIVVEIFNYILKTFPHYKIRGPMYALAIRASGKLGNIQMSLNLFDEYINITAKNPRAKPTAGVFLAAFNALADDKHRESQINVADARRVWSIMTESLPTILPPAYTSIAAVFAAHGEMETLDELVAFVAEDDSDDNLDIYDEPSFHANDEIFHDSVPRAAPNIYDGVFSGLSNSNSDTSDRIFAYLNDLQKQGYSPTDTIIRTSIIEFIKHKRLDLAVELTNYIDIRVLDSPNNCFGDVVSKLLETQMWSAAKHWMDFSKREECQILIRNKSETLEVLKRDFTSHWDCAYAIADNALNHFNFTKGTIDDVLTAVEICASAKQFDAAHNLFYHLKNHATVIDGKINIKTPLPLLKRQIMKLFHSRPQETSKNAEKRITNAVKMCDDMIANFESGTLDGEALSLAISAHSQAANDARVIELYEKIQQLGLEANSFAQHAAITAYSRKRVVEKVIEIRDEIYSRFSNQNIEGSDPDYGIVNENVLNALLLSFVLARDDKSLLETYRMFSWCCTFEHIISALVQANHLHRSVSIGLFDNLEKISPQTITAVAQQLANTHPFQAFTLLTKCQGENSNVENANKLNLWKLPGMIDVVVKTATAMVEVHDLFKARTLLEKYVKPSETGEIWLKMVPRQNQRQMLEMLLYVYAENRDFTKMAALFELKLLAFNFSVQHYEVAMEYCLDQKNDRKRKQDESEILRLVLRLFEDMHKQYVKPSGKAHVFALQSCYRMDALNTFGSTIIDSAKEHRFTGDLVQSLIGLAKKTVSAAIRYPHVKNRRKAQIDVQETAELVVFCSEKGIKLPEVAILLLEAWESLTEDQFYELSHIVEMHNGSQTAKKISSNSHEGVKKLLKENLYLEKIRR